MMYIIEVYWFIEFFDKKSSSSHAKIGILLNLQLATELHRPIIRKFKKQKVQSSFKDNIWVADLANMQQGSEFN